MRINPHQITNGQTYGTDQRKRMASSPGDKTAAQEQARTDAAVKVDISENARVFSRQSSLSVDDTILDGKRTGEAKTAHVGNMYDRNNFKEFADPSLEVNRKEGMVILKDDSPQERYRKELLNSTTLYGQVSAELDTVSKFGSVSSKYMELRKTIEDNYTGDELTQHLQWLDDSYDNAVNTMADHAAFDVKYEAQFFETKAAANNDLFKHSQTHGHTFGIPVEGMIVYDKAELDKQVSSLIQNITDSYKHYGALAKQYMLGGNAVTTAETDNNNFANYLMLNTDSNKGLLTIEDLNTKHSVFPLER